MSIKDFTYIPYIYILYLYTLVLINAVSIYKGQAIISYGILTNFWFIFAVLTAPIALGMMYDFYKKWLEEN